MTITFYFMNGCGFCTKAKEMLATEISNGEISIIPSSQAPKGINGFPTFSYKGKTHSGLPKTKEQLYNKLGYVSEGYSREYSGVPTGGRSSGWTNNSQFGRIEGYCNSKRKSSDNDNYPGVF